MNDSIPSPVAERRDGGMTTVNATVNILMCTNALFLQHAAVCLTSLLTNNPDFFCDIVD